MTSTTSTGPRRSRLTRTVAGSAVLLALTAGLSACGSPAGSRDAPSGTSTAAAAGQRGGRDGGGAQFQAIRECLSAAGIAVPTPTARPSRVPSGAPDGGAAPSGAASDGPRAGGPRGGGIDFSDKKVQAALKACGIAAPTARPTAQPSS